jgi:hypothetical protein
MVNVEDFDCFGLNSVDHHVRHGVIQPQEWSSGYGASHLKHGFNASVHFFFDKLTALRCSYPLLHSGEEARFSSR